MASSAFLTRVRVRISSFQKTKEKNDARKLSSTKGNGVLVGSNQQDSPTEQGRRNGYVELEHFETLLCMDREMPPSTLAKHVL